MRATIPQRTDRIGTKLEDLAELVISRVRRLVVVNDRAKLPFELPVLIDALG